MEDIGYIGYREAKVGIVPITTAATGGAAFPITAVIDAAIALAPFIINFTSKAFAHPAEDALGIISAIKPLLVYKDPQTRLATVIAASQKISTNAKDVDAEKLLLWYKQQYADDYSVLSPEAKIYFNNYLTGIKSTHRDGNNMYYNLQSAMFTADQINYNATPISTVSNLLSSTGLGSNTLIYIAIGVGLYLLIKK